MTGVVISYSRKDIAFATRVTLALRSLGVEVWWDQDMLSGAWRRRLEQEIEKGAAVIVLWSANSRSRRNKIIHLEATMAWKTDKLINTAIDGSSPLQPFFDDNVLPLDGWTGREAHHGWGRVVAAVDEHLCKVSGVEKNSINNALDQQLIGLRSKQSRIAQLTNAHQTALRDVEKQTAQVDAEVASVEAAEAQITLLKQVVVSKPVMEAALSVRDAARASLAAKRSMLGAASDAANQAAENVHQSEIDLEQWLLSIGAAPITEEPQIAIEVVPAVGQEEDFRPPVDPVKLQPPTASAGWNLGLAGGALAAGLVVTLGAIWAVQHLTSISGETRAAKPPINSPPTPPKWVTAPVWIFGNWGLDGNCKNQLSIERAAASSEILVTFLGGETSAELPLDSNAASKKLGVPEGNLVSTNRATYVLATSASQDVGASQEKMQMLPNGLSEMSYVKCPDS